MNPVEAPRILIVEDEAMVAMLIEDLLVELGYRTTGPVARVSEALACVAADEIDGAVLDVTLIDGKSFPIADALFARGIPFVFLTGYGLAGIDEPYRSHPVVQKPFTRDLFEQTLATHFRR